MVNRRASAPSTLGTSARTIRLALASGAVGAMLSFIVSLLLVPFALSRLGSSGYGAWIALSAVIGVASLAEVGIRVEVARRVALAHGQQDRARIGLIARQGTTVAALLVVPTALLLALFAPPLVELVLPQGASGVSHDALISTLRVLATAMCVSLVLNVHFAVLRGVQRTDSEAVAQMTGVIINATFTVVGLNAGFGLSAMVAGYCMGSLSNFLVLWYFSLRLLPGTSIRVGRISFSTVGGFLSLSGLALLSQIGDVVDSQWDKLVLARYVGAEAVTSFHVGTSLVLQAKVIAVLPLAPILVAVAELQSSGREAPRAVQLQLMKLGAVASATICASLVVFLPAFIHLWLGLGHADAAMAGQIFAIAALLNLISAPLAMQAFAEGRHGLCAIGATTNMAVNAVASLALTIHFGLLGAVYGSVLGNVAGTAVFLFIARRRLSYWIFPPCRAIVLAGLAVGLTSRLPIDVADNWILLSIEIATFTTVIALLGIAVERVEIRSFITTTRTRKLKADESRSHE